MPISRHLPATALLAAVTMAAVAPTAAAHVDPDPDTAPAGSHQDVGFTVEHGCDGSPTIAVDIRLAPGVTDAEPVAPAGWTGTIAGDVVTFTGGPLGDHTAETFTVSMTLPATPDTDAYFPVVQRCQVGEVRWIEIPSAGEDRDDLDAPAPAIALGAPERPTTTASTDGATPDGTISTGEPPVATVTGDAGDDDGGSGSVVFVVVVIVVVAGGAVLAWTVRRRR